ncbi:hypothetical protein II906_05935 [bacterium]|nr:hypothetical protein [bacterium]
MNENFYFLKKNNNELYKIISEAENLYRDEYFDQCMVQTRKFGEIICKTMLKENGKETGSFDDMLATLKDFSSGYEQEKEFIDDLYFLKKNGNSAAHSENIKNKGMTALECLRRSFEVAINYCVYHLGASADILKLNYDVELLIAKKKSKISLQEKYENAKVIEKKKPKIQEKKPITKPLKKEKTVKLNMPKPDIKIPLFWKFIFALSIISAIIIFYLIIAVTIASK